MDPIKPETLTMYQNVLAVVEALVSLDPQPDTPQGRLLHVLATAIEEWEREQFPFGDASLPT